MTKQANHTIHLDYEQDIDIILPDGRTINILLSHLDEDALPELEIYLPDEWAVNNWGNGLKEAPAIDSETPYVRIASQLNIPIETQ